MLAILKPVDNAQEVLHESFEWSAQGFVTASRNADGFDGVCGFVQS